MSYRNLFLSALLVTILALCTAPTLVLADAETESRQARIDKELAEQKAQRDQKARDLRQDDYDDEVTVDDVDTVEVRGRGTAVAAGEIERRRVREQGVRRRR